MCLLAALQDANGLTTFVRLPATTATSAGIRSSSPRVSAPCSFGPTLLHAASVRLFSTSSADTQASSPVLVKVGDSKWCPFEHADDVLGMHRIKLLKALKADDVFGGYFKGVEQLGECTVGFLKLPGGKKMIAAEEEKDATFVELDGAMAVRTTAASVAKDEQICIRVQLPSGPAALNGEWRIVEAASASALHAMHCDLLPSPS